MDCNRQTSPRASRISNTFFSVIFYLSFSLVFLFSFLTRCDVAIMLLSCQSHCGLASVTKRHRGPSRVVTEGAHLLVRVPVKSGNRTACATFYVHDPRVSRGGGTTRLMG
jgi:hypothetical protein